MKIHYNSVQHHDIRWKSKLKKATSWTIQKTV
jgi:hypothetical protein